MMNYNLNVIFLLAIKKHGFEYVTKNKVKVIHEILMELC